MWSVSVAPPLAYEPPTMATCALSCVHDARRKTGALAGKVPWLATCETTPFTEIATAGWAAVVVVVAAPCAGGTTVGPGTVGAGVAGVVLPAAAGPCPLVEL